jgi:hypothetical protein
MEFTRLLEHIRNNKEEFLEEILDEVFTPCEECGGFGHFSNEDGSDFTECEECLGEGKV